MTAITVKSLQSLFSHVSVPSSKPRQFLYQTPTVTTTIFHPLTRSTSGVNSIILRPITSCLATRASASGYSADISDVLGNVTIYSSYGEPVMFKDLWDQEEEIAVVALLRHFGCVCCWELAANLKEWIPKFESGGVKLIAVGVGTPDKARVLAERLPFPMDNLYADPKRKAYDVLGLYFGIGRTLFSPATAKVFSRFDSLQKSLENYTIEATPDDKSSVLQQGGMFVFKGKELLYAWKDEGTGDHASLDDVFEICCEVPAA